MAVEVAGGKYFPRGSSKVGSGITPKPAKRNPCVGGLAKGFGIP